MFQKSYRYIKATDLKKSVTSNDLVKKPSNVSGYELQTGSYALALNFDEIDKVKLTNSFSHKVKSKEVRALAESIGAKSYGIVVNIVNTVGNFESLDDVNIGYDFAYGSQKFNMYYSSGRYLRTEENRCIMKMMLKPYLPKGYKSIVNKYFDGQYYGASGYGPFEVEGVYGYV